MGTHYKRAVLATRAGAILEVIHGVRGTLQVTFEEGTHSAWLPKGMLPEMARLTLALRRERDA